MTILGSDYLQCQLHQLLTKLFQGQTKLRIMFGRRKLKSTSRHSLLHRLQLHQGQIGNLKMSNSQKSQMNWKHRYLVKERYLEEQLLWLIQNMVSRIVRIESENYLRAIMSLPNLSLPKRRIQSLCNDLSHSRQKHLTSHRKPSNYHHLRSKSFQMPLPSCKDLPKLLGVILCHLYHDKLSYQ